MNRIILTLVLSLCLLLGLTAPTYAMQPEEMYWLTDSLDTGLVYGPPIPQKAPKLPMQLASRGGDKLLQNVVAQNVPDTLTYKVQSGDSLSRIANLFGSAVDVLMQLNSITNPHLLSVNQEIKVPNLEKKLLTPELKVKEVVSADLTAYTAGPESTGKSPGDPGYGITASGAHVQDHRTIAVDPRKIPIGTKVYIEGIGVRVAEDTGGAIQGNRIDVYMSDLSAAIQFGYKRDVKVYILEESA
ncbi:MAG: 3D domain-containing protein [Tumebacillaceae bacterium]